MNANEGFERKGYSVWAFKEMCGWRWKIGTKSERQVFVRNHEDTH